MTVATNPKPIEAPWYLTGEALEAIRACIVSPPRKLEQLAPLTLWLRGTETITEYDDWTHDAADLLRRLSEVAYREAEKAGPLDSWIGVQEVLRFVLDGEGDVPGLADALSSGERRAAA